MKKLLLTMSALALVGCKNSSKAKDPLWDYIAENIVPKYVESSYSWSLTELYVGKNTNGYAKTKNNNYKYTYDLLVWYGHISSKDYLIEVCLKNKKETYNTITEKDFMYE